MTLVQHHKTVSESWKTTARIGVDDVDITLDHECAKLHIPYRWNDKTQMLHNFLGPDVAIHMQDWPAVRDAIDALHKVWEEQQSCQS